MLPRVHTPALTLTLWGFLACLAFISCRRSSSSSRSERAALHERPWNPGVLVIAHSFTGRTAEAGHEIASMLGGRFFRITAPPSSLAERVTTKGPSVEDVLARLDLAHVHTLFLGFPIHDLGPSATARRLADRLPLRGVRVVPFFTFLHGYDPRRLDVLISAIRRQGGLIVKPIEILLPLATSSEDIAVRVRRNVLARRDLWAHENEKPATWHCRPSGPPHDGLLCAVPAGLVWVGDTHPGSYPGAPPPRLRRLDAFVIDETEITIGQYQQCVEAGACPEIARKTVDPSKFPPTDDLPMAFLSFHAAKAYCRFVGLRLPTEAEWIRAGRGDTLFAYPWGNRFVSQSGKALANLGEKPGQGLPFYSGVPANAPWRSDGYQYLAPPCSFPAGRGRYGPCDLIGNLGEWVVGDDERPILKGGSWIDSDPIYASLGARAVMPKVLGGIGFFASGARCAGPARAADVSRPGPQGGAAPP